MPHYEFYCHACRKTFTKILTLVDYEEGGVVCPHCGSHKVRAMLVPFLRCHFEEECLRTKPAALHQKRALTLASLGPSFGDVSIGHSQTPSHDSYPAAQRRP